jgi:membrane protease subunit HflC
MSPRVLMTMLTVFAGLIVLFNTLFMVRQTEQVMVLALGRVERLVSEPGLHFKLPFYHQLVYFDRRILGTDSPSEEVLTADQQRVVVDSFTRWRIKDAALFFRSVRTTPVALQRLDNIVNSKIREQVAQVRLDELVNEKRDDVMGKILEESRKEAAGLGILVVDVRLIRADLPSQNQEAVFNRMRTEREAQAISLRAKGDQEAQEIRATAEKQRTIMLAEAQRDAQKLRGEGEAAATRLTGAAFSRDPEFFRLTRSLEAYKAAFTPSNTLMLLDSGNDFMRTLVNP